jgi:hypothetical protein
MDQMDLHLYFRPYLQLVVVSALVQMLAQLLQVDQVVVELATM